MYTNSCMTNFCLSKTTVDVESGQIVSSVEAVGLMTLSRSAAGRKDVRVCFLDRFLPQSTQPMVRAD